MSDQAPPPPPPEDRRSAKADAKAAKARAKAMRPWYRKKRFILPLGLVVLVVLIVAAGGGGGEDEDVDVASNTAATDPPAATDEDESDEDETSTTTEAPATTAAPQWTEVARLEGVEGKQGDTFTLTSGRQRLRYDSQAGIFAVYVMEEGKSLDEDGGIPETMCSEPCADETNLRKSPGDYYLSVTASGGAWTVVIEEMR